MAARRSRCVAWAETAREDGNTPIGLYLTDPILPIFVMLDLDYLVLCENVNEACRGSPLDFTLSVASKCISDLLLINFV